MRIGVHDCGGEMYIRNGLRYCPKCDTEESKWEKIKRILRRLK